MTDPHRKRRVAVLMGGTSSERPVSLATGRQIVAALDPAQYEVVALDTRDLLSLTEHERPQRALPSQESQSESADPAALSPASTEERSTAEIAPAGAGPVAIDVVFIALHGKGGEDGTVQGLLEFLGIPYTGSGVLASALAMNKSMTKRLLAAAGIPVIEDIVVQISETRERTVFESTIPERVAARLGFPVFVKPNAEGSSFGGTPVTDTAALLPAIDNALRYDPAVVIERYVRGREITVGVLESAAGDPEPLPIVEIVPRSAYYDYESKYADGGSEHIIPAELDEATTRRAQGYALECHRLLGCRGMSRTDMIVAGETIVVLEVNTIPGMTATSLLPQAAASIGITFPQLLDRIIASALRTANPAR